jgi:hypothetical protein
MKSFFTNSASVIFLFTMLFVVPLVAAEQTQKGSVANARQFSLSVSKHSAMISSPDKLSSGNEIFFVKDTLSHQWKITSVSNQSVEAMKSDRHSGSFAVAVEGDRAIVGAPWENNYQGAAYIVQLSKGAWRIEQKISPSNIGKNAHFGSSVDLQGDVAIIGASWENKLRGAVYVFKKSNGSWKQEQKLVDENAKFGSSFGQFVSLENGTLKVTDASSSIISNYSLSKNTFVSSGKSVEGFSTNANTPTIPNSVTSLLDVLETMDAPNWWNALLFDGVDDFGIAPITPHTFDAFTVEVWVKPASLPGANQAYTILDKRGTIVGENDNTGFELRIENMEDGNGIRFITLPNDGVFAPYTLPVNQWTHIAGTINGNESAIFINGVFAASASYSSTPENNDEWVLFARAGDGNYFHGTLDELMFWRTARSEEQIIQDMLMPIGNPWAEEDMFSYWQFDYVENSKSYQYTFDSRQKGIAYIFNYPLSVPSDLGTPIEPVERVTASYGLFEDRVVVQWSRLPNDNLLYEIFRDGELMTVASSEDSVYVDETGIRGVDYYYCVKVLSPDGFLSGERCEYGKRIVFEPTPFTASNNEFSGGVELRWGRTSNVTKSYILYRDGDLLAQLGSNVSHYFDTMATPGYTHEYSIIAKDSTDNYSRIATAFGVRAFVLPPTNFTATDGIYPDRVVLTWTNPAQTISNHRLFRDGNVLQAHVPAGDTLFVDYTATPGVTHTYCIWSSDGAHESKSVCDNGGIGVLPAPADVVATDEEFDDKVIVTWEDTSNLEDKYIVSRSDGKNDTLAANTTSFTDVTALPGFQYVYCVTALTDHGGKSQDVCDGGIRAIILAPDTLIASDSIFENRTVLAWSSKSTKVVLFKIYRDGRQIATRSSTTRSYEDFTGTANKKYEYAISAMDARGNESQRTHATGSRALRGPSNLFITKGTFEDRIVLTWQDNSGFERAYRIRRETIWGVGEIAVLDANRTSFTDSMYFTVSGQEYQYFVDAYDYDPNDHSDERFSYGYSEAATGTGSWRLRAPGNVQATDGAFEEKIVVSWYDSSQVESGYYIYRNGDANPYAMVGANVSSFTDGSPLFGQQTTYEVAAHRNYEVNISEKRSDVGSTTIFPPLSIHASNNYLNKVTISVVDGSKSPNHVVQLFRDGEFLTQSSGSIYFSDYSAPNPGTVHTYSAKTVAEDGVTASTEISTTGEIGPVTTLSGLYIGDNVQANKQTGYSVAVDGNHAVYGAYGATMVTFYERINGVWTGIKHVYGNANSGFGRSVAVSGDYAIIGAPLENKVYVFKWSSNTWSNVFNLAGGSSTMYGAAVAIEGDRVIVGAPNETFAGPGTGAAWLYSINLSTGALTYIVGWATSYNNAHLGSSVSVDASGYGGFDVFGAGGPGAPDDVGYGLMILHPRSVTSQEKADNTVSENLPRPTIVDFPARSKSTLKNTSVNIGADQLYFLYGSPEANNKFGTSISVNGGRVAIGSPANNSPGKVHMFRYTGSGFDEDPTVDSYLENGNKFGRSLALSSNKLLIGGGNYKGLPAVSLYNWSGQSWEAPHFNDSTLFIAGSGENAIDFGASVGLSSTGVIIGVPGESSTASYGGGVYLYDFNKFNSNFAEVSSFTASDGTYSDHVQLAWTITGTAPSGFRIYRDTTLLTTMSGTDITYSDMEIAPGKASKYSIAAFSNTYGESRRVYDYGWRPVDGTISGRVSNGTGTGVESVKVSIDPTPSKSILFDGIRGGIEIKNYHDLTNSRARTLEVWVRPSSLIGEQRIVGQGSSFYSSNTQISIRNGYYHFNAKTNSGGYFFESPIPPEDINAWVHLAGVYNDTTGVFMLYRNGEPLYFDGPPPTPYEPLDSVSWTVGSLTNNGSYSFSGEIDEVRIWNVARSQSDIQNSMKIGLNGKETGLVTYLTFDESSGDFITDATGKGHYGIITGGAFRSTDIPPIDIFALTDQQGNYTIPKINYGESTTFKVFPQKEESKFLPAHNGITLSTGNPVQNEVNFTDISSYSVTGYVRFAGTDCFAQNVQILVDGTPRATTDRSGTYIVAVSRGEHTIEAQLGDHTFSPASYQLIVSGNVAGKNFTDTKKRKITGKVAGGCNKAIGDVELTFRSENECFVTTLNPTTPTNYNIILSPQKYFVQVTNVNNVQAPLDRAAILEYFTNIGARAVDLTNADTTLDFIYHAPIKVQIAGIGGDTCAPLRARVLQQGPKPINLKIFVTEDYGAAGVCNVDTGTVTIIDEFNDVQDKPVTIGVKNGVANYTTYANTPNTAPGRYDASGFDRSYQKAITAIAQVIGQRPVIATQWAIVKGRKQRQGSRFVTGFSTPVPLYVIHDPPGDGSAAYAERGYSFCKKIDPTEYHLKAGGGLGVDLKLGVKFQNGVGFGVFLATETFFRAVVKLDITAGSQVDKEGATTICGTFADQYSTSADENFVGEDADVFVGYGENYLFATTDVVDVTNCQIVLPPPAIGFEKTGFSTTFAFTRGHIKNAVIPNLEMLKRNAALRASQGAPDSTAFFQSFINSWHEMLAWDSTQKARASLIVNRSFSAGADYQYSYQADTTVAYMEKRTIWLDQSFSAGLGFGTSGNESEIVGQQLVQYETLGSLTDTSGTRTSSFGYSLSDNDDGDNFTVDVMKGANVLSPIFKVKGGASSCPYEPWEDNTGKPTMTRRDLPDISLTPAAQVGIAPDQPAVFTVNLTNKSETEETRSYVLSIVDSSNRGGAIVTANGAPMYAGVPLTVPYNQTRYLTLTVERGPVFYDYSKLLLRVGPQCESNREDVSKTISLDVRFSAPCSDISLFEPSSGWLVNQADSASTHSKLNITMKDFLVLFNGRDSIIEIGAQYRRVGDVSWLPISSIRGSLLQEGKSASLLWDYSGITKDGEYEIRAYTKCASGNGYSSVVRGLIDRTPPQVFGAPQPADSVLTLGEEISIEFTERIDRNSITPASILMRKLSGGLPADTIAVSAVSNGTTIVITPLASAVALEGQQFVINMKGIKDVQGNPMQGSREWQFTVRRNGFIWSQSHISKDVPFHSSARFVARLSNGSQQDAHYTITEKPSWLLVDSETGTIRQSSVGEIVFTIPDTLRLGTMYSGRVSVTDPNIGVSNFTVSVNVSCELPDWTSPSNKYEYSMNIIDSLLIGSVPSTDTNDIVAAIIGGEVRGVAKLKFIPSVGYRIFMTVYSNNPRGERVKFRVWDASECRLYNSTFETFRFMKDTIIGDPYRPMPLTAIDAAAYDVLPISIKPGWNWFSTNVRAQDMTTTGVLSDIPLSQGDIIKSIDEFAVNDGNEWSGSLVELENTQSYMLKVKESGTLFIEGNFVDSTSRIPLRKGWNWISYLPKRTLLIDDAFANYGLALHDTDFIKAQVAFAKYVTAGSSKKWIGSLETMRPGEGYKLYAKKLASDTSFSYFPSGSFAGMNPIAVSTETNDDNERATSKVNATLADWNINPHAFESNMTMTTVLKIKNIELAHDSVFVGAFVGDECRGVVKVTYSRRYERWYAFLMLYSNLVEEDNFRLRVYDAKRGEIWEMADSIKFKADAIFGTMSSPVAVNATRFVQSLSVSSGFEIPREYGLFANYPNPFNPSTQIMYALPEQSHVKLVVYNILGQLVSTLVDGEEIAGYKLVQFDGERFASGMYFFRLEATSSENPERSFVEVKKMALVK